MSAGYEVFHFSRWLLFFVRLLLSILYGILSFISKPGSRIIVPVLLGIGLFVMREPMHHLLNPLIGPLAEWDQDQWNGQPSTVALARRKAMNAYYGYDVNPISLDACMVVIFLVTCIAYVFVSSLLVMVMGAFPKLTRPLRPLRRLEPTRQNVKPATVEIAVPKLRR